MPRRSLLGVALFLALPMFSQTAASQTALNQKTHSLLRFTLEEKPEGVARTGGLGSQAERDAHLEARSGADLALDVDLAA